jgi:hypothetical protein
VTQVNHTGLTQSPSEGSSLQAGATGISVRGMIYGNPGFVSGTGYIAQNYKLQASSPAVNKGLALS